MRSHDKSPAAGDRRADLEARWQRFGVHRASRQAAPTTLSTGWEVLDGILPGRGYPVGAVTEFLVEHSGSGELSLLLASLAPALDADPRARLAFVNPPYRLNAPALDAAGIDRSRVPVIRCATGAERLWSIEQLAAAGGFVAFVLWDDGLDPPALRRLQLAGEKAGCPVFVYRHIAAGARRSPAALRLALRCRGGRQQIEIVKCRGPAGARLQTLVMDRDTPWRGSAVPAPAFALRPADNESEADETGAGPVAEPATDSSAPRSR